MLLRVTSLKYVCKHSDVDKIIDSSLLLLTGFLSTVFFKFILLFIYRRKKIQISRCIDKLITRRTRWMYFFFVLNK